MRSYRINVSGQSFLVEIEERADGKLDVRVDGQPFEVEMEWIGDSPRATVTPDIIPRSLREVPIASRVPLPPQRPLPAADDEKERLPGVTAPMPGVILQVLVQPGETVAANQPLLILEAMKMKNLIKSPRAGTIAEVRVASGQQVAYGDLLICFDAPCDDEAL